MLRKWTLALITVLTLGMSVHAQDVAIVDINAILESMDEYQDAQAQLDKIAAEWRQEIAQEYDKIKSLYNKYQAEQVLLSEEVRHQREEEIMQKERAAQEMQRSKFGVEGELFRKRQELVNPIQDRVYRAIEEFAESRSIDIIFDKSSNAGLIYAGERYDKTEDIKKKLGI